MPWVPCTHPTCDDNHFFPDDEEVAVATHLWKKRKEERAGTCECRACLVKKRQTYTWNEYVYVLEDGTVVWWTTQN